LAAEPIANNEPNTEQVISVVTVLDGRADSAAFVERVAGMLTPLYRYFEIIVVDNAPRSDPGSTIWALPQAVPQVRVLQLSRHYDLEIALLAGLDSSLGDFVVLIDSASDPIELVPVLLEQACSGYDVVIAEAWDGKGYSLGRRLAVWLSVQLTGRLLGYPTIPTGDYFRVLSRQAVNSVNKIRNKRRYLKYFNTMAGFRQTHVSYERSAMTAAPNPRARDIVLGTIDLILSNTAIPLRVASMLGIVASFLALSYLLYVLVISMVKNHIAEGWITTSVTTTTMFLILFLILTVLSEYVARIHEETKEQPLYFVDNEISSSTPRPTDTLNVV
jgi:glycosyltransferase involved in cell wall biosynthesis